MPIKWITNGSMLAAMTNLNSRTKARQSMTAALAFIEGEISTGAWKPGERLPAERELVERFGLARNTLRKILDRLETKGVITRHVGRGTFVAELSADHPSSDELVRKIHRASPAEVMDIRLMLEPQSCELAAARATASDFAEMERCLRECETAKSVAAFEMWDGRLHQRIIAAARNQLLADIYDAINGVRRTAQWGKLKERSLTVERRAIYQEQHRRIVGALRQRDGEAARADIRDHLLSVRESLGGL